MAVYSTFYVDLSQNSTGFTGEFPAEPFGFTEFISALSNVSYIDSVFKLKGTVDTATTINFDNFYSLEQWIPGTPWRIKADIITISANKNIKGGILYATIGVSTGDLTCDDNVNFYSCYVICKNFNYSDPSLTVRSSYFYGCTVNISNQLQFTNSRLLSFNSVFNIAEVYIDSIDFEEAAFRSSVVNLQPLDFSTAFKERSDNGTNQYDWETPVNFPEWDTCVEDDFNFSNVYINSSGDPYAGYELGLFGSERTDTISDPYEYVGLGATGVLRTLYYMGFSVDVQSGPNPLSVKFTPIINSLFRVSRFIWHFGDGVKSNESVPTHIYKHGGEFSPIVEMLFVDGKNYKKLKKNLIKVFKVSVVPSEFSGKSPFSVKFTAVPSLPEGVSILGYDWDFGDNSSHSTEVSPTHLYNTVNSYNVKLKNTFIKT